MYRVARLLNPVHQRPRRVLCAPALCFKRTLQTQQVQKPTVLPHASVFPPPPVAATEAPEHMSAFRDMTLDDILAHKKSAGIVCVGENDFVYSAIGVMEQRQIGAVLVHDNEGLITGIFTERDYLRKVALRGLSSKTTQVKSIMTRNVKMADSSTTAREAMALMTSSRFRHLPVQDGKTKEVVGLISQGDVIRSVLDDVKVSALEMQNMITGRYPA